MFVRCFQEIQYKRCLGDKLQRREGIPFSNWQKNPSEVICFSVHTTGFSSSQVGLIRLVTKMFNAVWAPTQVLFWWAGTRWNSLQLHCRSSFKFTLEVRLGGKVWNIVTFQSFPRLHVWRISWPWSSKRIPVLLPYGPFLPLSGLWWLWRKFFTLPSGESFGFIAVTLGWVMVPVKCSVRLFLTVVVVLSVWLCFLYSWSCLFFWPLLCRVSSSGSNWLLFRAWVASLGTVRL